MEKQSANGEIAGIIDSAANLAKVVGPGWGLATVFIILAAIPRWGLFAHLLQVWKEDRADDRNHREQMTRLAGKYRNRPDYKPPHKKK